MRTEQEYKNLDEAKDATIAQQAEQLAALTLALKNSENRHVFEAPEGMCFMPENTPIRIATLEKERDASLAKCTELEGQVMCLHDLRNNKPWAELAALAEQFEKMNELLRNAMSRYEQWLIDDDYDANRELTAMAYVVRQALALPDIATPALNRIEARGMLKAAEICKEQGEEWDSDYVIADKNYADHCATLIRARAAELEGVKS